MNKSLLNYSTHCLQNWMDNDIIFSGKSIQSDVYKEIASYLSTAPKFILPNGGKLIDGMDSIAKMMEEVELAYPCVVLEFEPDKTEIFEHQLRSSKRIALVWDLRKVLPDFVKKSFYHGAHPLHDVLQRKRNSLLIQAISYFDDYKTWICIAGSIEIPLVEPSKTDDKTIGTLDKLKEHGIIYGKKLKYDILTIPHLHEYNVKNSNEYEIGLRSVSHDTADEVLAALNFAVVSSCANIKAEVVEASKELNKKRKSNGKVLFFDSRILTVADGHLQGTANVVGTASGTHSSPVTHLRRGHPRKLHSGNGSIWINAMVINASSGDALRVPSYKMKLVSQQ